VNFQNRDQADDGDFAQLMAAAESGDVDAQRQICERYEPKLRIVARVMLGPALRPYLDSIDLVQSVHRSLLMGLRDHKFDISSPEKLIALAKAIVRRKVARKWQANRRQQRLNGNLDSQDLVGALSSLSSPGNSPLQVAQFNDHLRHFCQCLSEVEKRMLELRLEGYSSEEVAKQLGIHPVALRVRWSRLRKRLDQAGVIADWIS
jgi:RNA polymerase sigma factor (sigma-70 family)